MSEQAKELTGAEDIAWDLSDLYASVDDPQIDLDLKSAQAEADQIAEEYRGRIADLDAEEMMDFIKSYETLSEKAGRLGVYAYLMWSTNTADATRGALLQRTTEFYSALSQTLVFVDLEWAAASDEVIEKMLADPTVGQYKHWLEVKRLQRPYLLTEPEEQIIAEKNVTGNNAWTRFYDQTLGAKTYEFEGEQISQAEILTKVASNPDREVRKLAAKNFTEGLKELSPTTTYVFNTLLADKSASDKRRGYATWISARNLANEVEDSAVEALIDAVTSRYDIVARYYNLKRDLLGYDELFDYDRYAPLPAADRIYQWSEAKEIILNAFGVFHEDARAAAALFFDNNWIDAPVRPGKSGGAYCYGIGGESHPYVFMNYEGKPRDVMTLAHELGHGIHGVMAQPQGVLQSSTPITMAETASVFAEMLVFNDLMSRETDPAERLALLTGKIEDSFATVFRQISLNRFEALIHKARREGAELSTEKFTELWRESQEAMFEGSVTLTEDYGIWWSYIPHFIHTPGYVYGYAFGNLLVLALYAKYQEVGESFAEGYNAMLAAGGSEWPHELAKPLGIDLTDPDFWKQGVAMLGDMVAEAEELAKQL